MQALFAIMLYIVAVAGYILNIVSLCKSVVFTGMMVARVIGIFFPPLGCVLGFI